MAKTWVILVLLSLLIVGFLNRAKLMALVFSPRNSTAFSVANKVSSAITNSLSPEKPALEVVAKDLNIPWEIAFLPSGDMLVTERPGRLLKIGKETKVISEIAGVKHIGEGGLLGMALHPKFSTNSLIYLYSTTQTSSGVANRVERYKLTGDTLTDRTVILEGIKGSTYHDGGRIAFGPDGYLYVTVGDAEIQTAAQDKSSLNGKILRIKDDGGIPSDNPFGNAVFSMGHRNPQGLAWDAKGNLWATEHGPSGAQTGNDEVNLIVKGGNYGWPDIKGAQTKGGMITPVIESGKSDTWAPSGLLFYKGSLYFAGLRGETLYQAPIGNNNTLTLSKHFTGEFGRLRTVALGSDGYFYLLTSNRDGRGKVKDGDDKIIRVKSF